MEDLKGMLHVQNHHNGDVDKEHHDAGGSDCNIAFIKGSLVAPSHEVEFHKTCHFLF